VRELYQVVEVGPSWYQENIPCQEACPVRTNCRGYLNLAAAGEFEKGWELALDPNPMASICGSVCAAPCETACRRKEVDKPLSIRYVKKFLSDWTHDNVKVDGGSYTPRHRRLRAPASGRGHRCGVRRSGRRVRSREARLQRHHNRRAQPGCGTALAGVPPFRLPRGGRPRRERDRERERQLHLSTYVGDVSLRAARSVRRGARHGWMLQPNYPTSRARDGQGVMAGIVF
jgi:hypothetical protein